MAYTLKIVLKTIIIFICLFILWVIGLFAQLPLIPWIETDYYVAGSNQTLDNGFIIDHNDGILTKFEIPREFNEDDQCFDFWFLSAAGRHTLTVKDFSQTVFDKNETEVKAKESYLFWDNGSKDETFKIDSYEIVHSINFDKKKYVFFRSVFDLDNSRNFSVKLTTKYTIDNREHLIDTTLQIEKKHRLTWNKLRLH